MTIRRYMGRALRALASRIDPAGGPTLDYRVGDLERRLRQVERDLDPLLSGWGMPSDDRPPDQGATAHRS